MTSSSDANTVYNATTTSLIIHHSNWRKRFVLLSGILLTFIGLILTIVFCYTFYSGGRDGDGGDYSEAIDLQPGEHPEDETNWILFVMGLVLFSSGAIILIGYVLYHRRYPGNSDRRGLIIVPKPKQSSRVLVVEQDKSTNNANSTSEEKAELMRNELRNDKTSVRKYSERSDAATYQDPDPESPIPPVRVINHSHYKPRNFNQHGYGNLQRMNSSNHSNANSLPRENPNPNNYSGNNKNSTPNLHLNPNNVNPKHAPIATMDEFDYSLRSSMNSVWSQHVHSQFRDSYDTERDSDLDDNENLDTYSFQSVVLT